MKRHRPVRPPPVPGVDPERADVPGSAESGGGTCDNLLQPFPVKIRQIPGAQLDPGELTFHVNPLAVDADDPQPSRSQKGGAPPIGDPVEPGLEEEGTVA